MTKSYTCPRCGYVAHHKWSMRLHFQRKRICAPVLQDIPAQELATMFDGDLLTVPSRPISVEEGVTPQEPPPTPTTNHPCPFCTGSFPSLVDLAQHCRICAENMVVQYNNTRLYATSSNASGSQQHITTNNYMQNITQVNVIVPDHLKAFGDEDTSHLTYEHLKTCVRMLNVGMRDLISMIHFNPEVPTNHNIKMKSPC